MHNLDIHRVPFVVLMFSATLALLVCAGCGTTDAATQDDAPLGLVEGEYSPEELEDMIRAWPKKPRAVARRMLEKHGSPHGVTHDMVVWKNAGQWLRTVVYRRPVVHEFPYRHQDCLQQSIRYQIPAERIDDIVRFSGSIIYDRTAGILSSRCNSEAMNTLAINLVHRIIDDGMSVEQAREEFEEIGSALRKGERPLMTRSLRFAQAREDTGDRDEVSEGGS